MLNLPIKQIEKQVESLNQEELSERQEEALVDLYTALKDAEKLGRKYKQKEETKLGRVQARFHTVTGRKNNKLAQQNKKNKKQKKKT